MRIERAGHVRRSVWLALTFTGAACAGDRFTPYGGAEGEYNSNIYYLDEGESALDPNADSRLDDTVRRYFAGLELKLPFGAQTLRAALEGDRFVYGHFTDLDHDEYHVGAGLDWRASKSVDGVVDYHQEERMASFLDRDSRELTLETESIGFATLNVFVTPVWRVSARLHSRELDSPLPDAPDFSLFEDTIDVAVERADGRRVNVGAYAEYLDGRYEGIIDATKFRERTAGLSAGYLIDSFSRLKAQIGSTRRDDDAGGTVDAITGKFEYHRELSGKTSMDAKVFRRVDSYVSGASAVVNSGVGAGLMWQATQKLSLTAAYEWSSGRFSQSAPSDNVDRKDDDQLASVNLTYRMRPWFSLRAYGGYQGRNSNIALESFNATIAGFTIEARF